MARAERGPLRALNPVAPCLRLPPNSLTLSHPHPVLQVVLRGRQPAGGWPPVAAGAVVGQRGPAAARLPPRTRLHVPRDGRGGGQQPGREQQQPAARSAARAAPRVVVVPGVWGGPGAPGALPHARALRPRQRRAALGRRRHRQHGGASRFDVPSRLGSKAGPEVLRVRADGRALCGPGLTWWFLVFENGRS